ASQKTVSIILNHGGGRFFRVAEFPGIGSPAALAVVDLNGDGKPGIAVLNQIIDTLSILRGDLVAYSPDCNATQIPDDCDGLENDCNSNKVPDECDISSGRSRDCNRNHLPDECDPDCNANSVPDECDLAAGTSADCNANSVPDECDLSATNFGFAPSVDL